MAIKVYTNLDQGAPVLNGLVGQAIAVLDAVLVNGYGSVPITSITRAGAVATVTTSAAHGFATGDSALIAGANEADYNGDVEVTVLTTTTFTFPVANAPTTPATGTLTSKRASANFTKSFSASNVAAYRANDLASNRHYLQIRDDGTGTGGNREFFLRGFETMSSATAGTGPFPTVAQNTNAYSMSKSSTTDSTARPWVIITDGFMVYMWVHYAGTAANGLAAAYNGIYTCCFGDIKSYKAGDAYQTIVGGSTSENQTTSVSGSLGTGVTAIPTTSTFAAATPICFPRDFTGTGSAKLASLMATGENAIISASVQVQYPNPVDGGLYIVPVAVVQGLPSAIRGVMCGMYESMHGVNTHQSGDILSNVGGLSGRKLRWMSCMNGGSNAGHFIDVTGPWR